MSYALGAATATSPKDAGPVSASAWAQANNLAETAGRIMEDPFLDDVIYNHTTYSNAFRRTQSTLQRLGQAAGIIEMPAEEAKQLILGSVQQAKRGIAHIRAMSYSAVPRARQLEQQAIAAVGALLHSTSQALDAAKRSQHGGTAGLGAGVVMRAVFSPVLIAWSILQSLLGSTIDVDSIARSMAQCETEACRQTIADGFLAMAQNAGNEDENNPGPLDTIWTGVLDVFKPIIYVAAAGIGVYALWVFSPALIGGGRKVRGALKKRVAANPRRRRRRTSRRRRR